MQAVHIASLVFAQDNVALIAVLEASEAPGKSVNRDRRQLVCVANTHVHSNPELTDVKLWQVITAASDVLHGLTKFWVGPQHCF